MSRIQQAAWNWPLGGAIAVGAPAPRAIDPHQRAYRIASRSLDLVIAITVLIAAAPLLLVAMAMIRLTSAGGAIFSQSRCGIGGRPFRMYKLRTMCRNAEVEKYKLLDRNHLRAGPCFKMKDDPRVTPVGRWLRKFSIDELPQLWNVIRGEMAIVGPRPVPLNEVRTNTIEQRMRISVKPGLTCLWQVSGRTEIPYEEWVALDAWYVKNRSLWLDLRIIGRTIPAVLSTRGAY